MADDSRIPLVVPMSHTVSVQAGRPLIRDGLWRDDAATRPVYKARQPLLSCQRPPTPTATVSHVGARCQTRKWHIPWQITRLRRRLVWKE